MAWTHKVLALAYPFLRLRTGINWIKGSKSPRLRVLMYHDIPPGEANAFESQLRWLARRWNFISPETFTKILDGKSELQEDSLLLTFDDGFVSNRQVAEAVLDPLNIKAIFFVVPNFINLDISDDWRRFVATNICPGTKPEQHPSWRQNMTWDDLRSLSSNGHTIGAHTLSHPRLSCLSQKELINEILGSAAIIEKNIGERPVNFAYTFGDISSFSPEALSVARQSFKYIYSGIRGNNAISPTSWAILRDAISVDDKKSLVGAILEGGADWWYAKAINTYRSWNDE